MSIIKPNSNLKNNYDRISAVCNPVDKVTLCKELEKGINSLGNGKKYSSKEVFNELDKI